MARCGVTSVVMTVVLATNPAIRECVHIAMEVDTWIGVVNRAICATAQAFAWTVQERDVMAATVAICPGGIALACSAGMAAVRNLV